MAVKTIAQLRTRFAAEGAAPTQQDYVDLVDTLMNIEEQVDDILIALQPVEVVADEAARLALGPTLALYRKVKQTDNGITYVKQTGDGSNPADWVDIGDVQLVIPDVISLQDELDRRLNKIADDSTTGQLGLSNFYQSVHRIDATTGSDVLETRFAEDKVVMVYRSVDFTILPDIVDTEDVNAQTILLVKNVSASPISVFINRPVGIDFAFVLDQSGSMADARLLMPDVVRGLEAQLNALGVGNETVPNRYAMFEFSGGRPAWPEIPFTDYATFLAATQTFAFPVYGWTEDSGVRQASQSGTLVTLSGGGTFVFTDTLTDAGRRINWDTSETAIIVSVLDSMHVIVNVSQTVAAGEFDMDLPNPNFWQEDGYEGIDRAIDMLAWRNSDSVVKLLFLMTDEDRNSAWGEPTFPTRIFSKGGPTWQEQRAYIKNRIVSEGFVLAGLFGQKTPLIRDDIGNGMLGMDWTGRCYAADGAGGYTEHTGGHSWPQPTIYSKYDTSDFADVPGEYAPGQYEDYFELMIDPDVKGYVLDIWEYREQLEPGTYANASNTAAQVGNIVTITPGGTGGYLFTDTATDGGRMISISGAPDSSMILQVNSSTEAVVHNSQAVTGAAFSVARRWWQGYNKNASQSGTTVTLSSSSTVGFLFGSTTTDAGMVIRFSTGDFATIVTVTDSTHAEVDVSQTVAASAFLVWPNVAAANMSRSVLATIVPMLSERVRQELSQFIVSNPDFVFPMTLQPDEWKRFVVTGATVPAAGTIPGRKLLLG